MLIKKRYFIYIVISALVLVGCQSDIVEETNNMTDQEAVINQILVEEARQNMNQGTLSIEESTDDQSQDGNYLSIETSEILDEELPLASVELVDPIAEAVFELKVTENELLDYVAVNEDFSGIVSIEGTVIDFPVVKGQDNDFYLKRDINKKKNYYGSIFMDYRNFGAGFDKNIIIYGHNMKDDEMFGTLRQYMNPEYAEENSIITYQDLYSTKQYKVFATYFAENDGDLITTSFTDESFAGYLDNIMERSAVDLGVDVSSADKIITLVTCSYDLDDGRYFVHAVEIEG